MDHISRPSPTSSTAQQGCFYEPSDQPAESQLTVADRQMGEGPDQWGQDTCPDFDLVGVPAADRIFGLDVDAVVPGSDEAAALLREDLASLLVHADQTQVVPPSRYQVKEEDPGLDLLSFVEFLRPPVRARVVGHAARGVDERIAPDQYAPGVIR
jgi:hypothetical protein